MKWPHPSLEVHYSSLIPGQQYWSYPVPGNDGLDIMRGTFIEYYVNISGYDMVRFRPAYVKIKSGGMREYGPFNPNGFTSRIWPYGTFQMRRYYKLARFTPAEVSELRRRVKARERREAQRGLMGSFPEGRVMGSWPREKLPAVIIGLIAKCL